MTDQWILLHSVAIDCILSLLHNFSYLLPCNKPPPNVVTWNINIYLCLILNLGRTQGRWFISALCGSVGVTHVNVFSCKLSLGCHIQGSLSSFWASVHMASTPTARKREFQEDKPQCADAYHASACITLANVILAKANHMAKPRGREEGGFSKAWMLGDESPWSH